MDRNSDLGQITVNANNIPDGSVDCGIRRLGWCRGPGCTKFARLRTFVLVLAAAGLLQGACETYFRISAKQAAVQNGYDPMVVDWLLVSSGLFQALLALVFTYWADRLHPISWLGGTIMLQAATCVIAVIPSIINFSDGVPSSAAAGGVESDVCRTSLGQLQRALLSPEQSRLLTLVMLFVLQLLLGLGSLAFYALGVGYIDDNSQSLDSPAVIGATLAARVFGLQVGSLLTLAIGATTVGWWLGWAVLGPLIFVSGLLLSLFPKRLPKTVIHQAAQRIIEETRHRSFGSQLSTYIDDVGFGPSLRRLLGNRLLMCNLMGLMFIHSAALNYAFQEENYLQSRFYLPFSEEDGLLQEWQARFVSYFLRPPVAAVSMLVGGLVIAKLKLSGRTITGINIGLGVKLLAIYVGYVFIKCDVGPIAGIANGKLLQPYCSRQCICSPGSFLPVCPENTTVTYFSPCYAGCSLKTTINNVELYEGCTCSSDFGANSWTNVRATAGACSAETCSRMLVVFQVLSLSAAAVLGMSAIGKIIITLRSVLPQDKALALALELTFVGLFTYVPVKLGYDVATRTTCVYWAPEYERCLLRETPLHGNILNIMSACLTLVGIVFDVLVFVYAKGLNVYNCKVTDHDYTPSLYAPVPGDDPADQSPAARGGSPATTLTSVGGPERGPLRPTRAAPNPEITVFRQPSSLTDSSAGEQTESNAASDAGVTYAQVVFPPDKRKTANSADGSPRRMAVRADVPLHHLSAQDVRTQLGNLRSFSPPSPPNVPGPNGDDKSPRPQSPETDF